MTGFARAVALYSSLLHELRSCWASPGALFSFFFRWY